MMNQPSMRVMSKEYMLAHAGECVAISDDGLSFEAVVCGGGGGGGVTNITYADLVTAIGASGLTAGAQYKITDYATVHYIVDANGTQYLDSIITGVNEPLIVTASSSNTLEPVAYSALHPEDIIHYDFNPANWLTDKSFADFTGAPVIITGFKGVIYFRHDTLFDNYMGYDFRNCKFRRWKTNLATYNSGTTYDANAFVNSVGFIYKSLRGSNTNNTPVDNPDYWVKLLDLSYTEYWCNNPDENNGIIANPALFDDFKTFTDGVGSATYSLGVRSNHFEGFKDTYTFFGSILLNNVFFLQDFGIYCVYLNTIQAGSFGNTIVSTFDNNQIGSTFQFNLLGVNFGNNNVGANWYGNAIAANFQNNSVAGAFSGNWIAEFNSNSIGAFFQSNSVGTNFNNNSVGENFYNNAIASNFQNNSVENKASSGIDYTNGTHVYTTYNTTIFSRVDGTAKLSYCDNSDVIQVVNANA